jgi:hypothetical protein
MPVVAIVATLGTDETQVTAVVRSIVLPSFNVPVAVKA